MQARRLNVDLQRLLVATISCLGTGFGAHAQQLPTAAAPGTPTTNTPSANTPSSGIAVSKPRTSGANGSAEDAAESIVVTGTREANKKARDSTSPIDVVSNAQIANTGQTNLIGALTQLLPSVTTPAEGAFVNSAPTDYLSLRGLNPNQTLVLVDGKRFHTTSNVYVGGFADGSTPVDLDLIPPEMIDHVEILRDGAAAQYGSDAVAGVINIITKKTDHGGSANGELGNYYAGDGFTANLGGEQSVALGSAGYLDLSADYRHQDPTNRDTLDDRTNTIVDRIVGDPESTRFDVGATAGYTLPDGIELYTAETYAYRQADVYGLYRLPSTLPSLYPGGFTPQFTTFENDFSAGGGLRGNDLFGWSWDLSSTYGGDFIDNNVLSSANTELFAETGYTPTTFHQSTTETTLLTDNLDVHRLFQFAPLAYPLGIAAGIEQRYETFSTGAGSLASYELGGAQGNDGLLPGNVGTHSRIVYSAYTDLATQIITNWRVDVAGRFEHYTDFGNTFNGKISTRYDFTPKFGMRGTISNGTRAPSLANEYFSALETAPTFAYGTLAADSAGARLLGGSALKPERSTNFTAGFVYEPLPRLHVTVDAYQIDIRDRIVTGQAQSGAAALEAYRLAGISVPSGLSPEDVSASYFVNGASTRSRGIDLTSDYRTYFGQFGRVDWDFSLNANYSRVTHANIETTGLSDLTPQNIAYLTTSTPKNKIIFGGHWVDGHWDLLLHELRYGTSIDELTYDLGPNAYSTSVFYRQYNRPRFLTNIEFGFRLIDSLRLAVGANNLFDVYPSHIPAVAGFYGAGNYDISASQISINGGFYYLKAGYTF